jgi:diadenosine tetraphosphatase ApaH/serine/threonine PP2A family protein phosphatase
MVRFTGYRRRVSQSAHDAHTRNGDDEAQYEGVVFSDGKCAVHWLTATGGLSLFDSLELALRTHGHPELGTEIVWHDGAMPPEWEHMLVAHAEKRQHEFHHAGYTDVTLREERDADNRLIGLALHTPGLEGIMEQIYPVPVS